MLSRSSHLTTLLSTALLIALLAGCPAGTSHTVSQDNALRNGLLEACTADSACSSELCTAFLYSTAEEGICTKECVKDADCTPMMGAAASCKQVATLPEIDDSQVSSPERSVCVLPCTDSDPGAYECLQGTRVFCSVSTEASCEICGCPETAFCDSKSQRCQPYGHLGKACAQDSECLSGHCEDDACTGGQGDECDASCDGSCGGPADKLYCMPTCNDGRCPTALRWWSCLSGADNTGTELCSRVCIEDSDCIGEGDVCEQIAETTADADWNHYFTGYCRQPRPGEAR